MSNWTMDEVNELMDKNAGGNAAAVHIWLAKAPRCGQRYPGGTRPKEGDRVDIFKQFVLDAYEYGKFRADTPYVPGEGSSVSLGSSETTPSTSKAGSPTPVKRAVSGGGSSLETSRTASPQVKLPVQPPAKPSSSFDAFSGNNVSTDPFQNSFDQRDDPFGYSNNTASVKSVPSSSKKNQLPVQQQSNQPNLIDFSDPTPVTTSSTKSSVSLLDAFSDMSFNSAPPVPAPIQQPPVLQPPVAPAAPVFDPFGSDFITPVGSGTSSPVRQGYSNGMPHTNSNPNFNQYNGNNWQSQSPVGFQQPTQPQPQYQQQYANPTPAANNGILDLFSGMTYDANSSGKNTGLQPQPGFNNNANWAKPSPMMQSSSAISQIDVFASMGASAPAPTYAGANAGRWNAPPNAAYGARPMAPPMAAPMARPTYGAPPAPVQQGDKFDFLQEAVKQHLPK